MNQTTTESTDLAPKYAPSEVEPQINERWNAAHAFHAEAEGQGPGAKGQGAEPYAIVIPPPNVTAALHMGHALNNTLQDILTRWHRMKGDNTMWMPGTDHAGIATQTIVDKRLQSEGKPALAHYKRLELEGKGGRDQFIAKVEEWKDEYEERITNQLKLMGCSCDWDRQRFTMDEVCAAAVREAFFQLFKDGLIYRGKRLVNWDPVSQTALADDEVEMEEIDGQFYYLKYPVVEGTEGTSDQATKGAESSAPGSLGGSVPGSPSYITVATTRPETMLGDTAVAINPKDPRAASLRGKFVRLPIVNRIIPIIEDDYVVLPVEHGGDPADAKAQFATGFLKVTPAHDPNDYDIGQRHKLPIINVMAPDASISKDHGWPAEEWEGAPSRQGGAVGAPSADAAVASEGRTGSAPPYRDGALDPFAHELLGKSREDARKMIVRWFKEHDLLEEQKPYKHSVGHSYRSHVPIEPYLSDQWYVKVTDDRLRGAALRAMVRDQYDATSSTAKAHGLPSVGADGSETNDAGTHGQETVGFGPAAREGVLRFYPARYAKTFQQWHENIRDWCISRQLWWGHRIPVWRRRLDVRAGERDYPSQLSLGNLSFALHGSVPQTCGRAVRVSDGHVLTDTECSALCGAELNGEYDIYICTFNDEYRAYYESRGFAQDPDVLDTWFSSGLWPISTLGWPDPRKFPQQFPDGDAALQTWNPSNLLCTAREIITLWVSRMVMFNIYFRACVPFRDVFIHAMIQDGHGQKMSKTLGNGIDPLDIIHSHGSDGMRFTLASMTTQTQDVRMPVDIVCPHCGHAFTPKFVQSKGGMVAGPTQECPSCKKEMTSSYGLSSGKAKPTDAMPLARNTSEKFDFGRNFANKLWNAVRFALGSLGAPSRQGGATGEQPADASDASAASEATGDRARTAPPCRDGALPDRWILSRLAATISATNKALENYEFKPYVDGLYDFIWRDFCDWYIEAIKPTVATSANQQRVLVSVIDAILRLLHPAMPFITEKLWERLNAVAPDRGLEGLPLSPSELLIKAAWPTADESLRDDAAEKEFDFLQQVIGSLREVRTRYKVPPRQSVTCSIKTSGDDAKRVNDNAALIASLANIEIAAIGEGVTKEQDAAAALVGSTELYLHGLVDADAECKQLAKQKAEKEKSVAALKGRLSNKAYTDKAPANLVQQTRDQLAAAEKELEAVIAQMNALGCK